MPRDMVMMGMLKTIGIEKGKPYKPDDKTKAIYRKAVVDAYHYMQATFARGIAGRDVVGQSQVAQHLFS